MSEGKPQTHRSPRLVLSTIFVLAFGMTSIASDCAGLSTLGPWDLVVEDGESTGSLVAALPFMGRVTLDVRISNPSSSQIDGELLAQIRSGGEPFADLCGDFLDREDIGGTGLSPFDGEAEPGSGDEPLIQPGEGARLFVAPTVIGERSFGWARISTTQTELDIAVEDPTGIVRLFDSRGNEVPLRERSVVACGSDDGDLIAVHRFRATATDYLMLLDTADSEFAASSRATCAFSVVVDATCPGAEGEVVSVPFELPPGESLARHVGSGELGIGDELVLTMRCEEPGCPVDAEAVASMEQLECETNAACSGSQSCSVDGYCLRDASGCNVGHHSGLPWLVTLLFALSLAYAARSIRSSSRNIGRGR